MAFERDERMAGHALRLQLRRPAKFGQIDDEGRAHRNAAHAPDELVAGLGGAASGDQIVDDENPLALRGSRPHALR